MSDKIAGLIKYPLAIIFGVATALALLAYRGVFGGELTASELLTSLADAFTVPGILMLAVSALIWVSTLGLFDGVAYALGYAVCTLIPGMRYRRIDGYYDYKRTRENKRIGGYGFLALVGLCFLLVGALLTSLVYPA